MKDEVDTLEKNGTWHLTTPTKHALGYKWVYLIKLKYDGTVEKYKARLVILGNTQVEGRILLKPSHQWLNLLLPVPFWQWQWTKGGNFIRWT